MNSPPESGGEFYSEASRHFLLRWRSTSCATAASRAGCGRRGLCKGHQLRGLVAAPADCDNNELSTLVHVRHGNAALRGGQCNLGEIFTSLLIVRMEQRVSASTFA